MRRDYDTVIDLIPLGARNSVSMQALSNRLGINPRLVRKAVLDARLDGVIICSSSSGYFLPETVSELDAFYRSSRSRALTTLKSLSATRRALKDFREVRT